jgi:hypothetical protein
VSRGADLSVRTATGLPRSAATVASVGGRAGG